MSELAVVVTVSGSLDETIEKTTAVLQNEGFGVLTRIDVHDTFKEKIGVDFRPYVILGACNPKLAHRALSSRPEIGLLMPCNVTVEEAPAGRCKVRFVNFDTLLPSELMADDDVREVSIVAREGLERAASALSKSVA